MVKPAPPAFLFTGSDDYLKEKAIKDLATSLLDDSSRDLDYKVFYAADTAPDEIIGHINTVPFLASKKLVVIRSLEKAPSALTDRIAAYLKKPLRTTCLILEASGDKFTKENPDISRLSSVRVFGRMDGRGRAAWIRDFLSARKKRISADAVTLLAEMCGADLAALSQELEKLASYAGERPGITASDVESVIGRSLIASTFDLADAIGCGRTAEAVRMCHDLMVSGKRGHEIIGLISWHLKRLLRAKSMQSRGDGDNTIAQALRIMPQYRAGFFRQVMRSDMALLRRGLRTLLEADLDIKRTRFDQSLVLECAVISLCLGRASS
jgi:DNA polymerase-3 subunit delta